ncbi:MAG: YgcG family protein [Anaerofustis sp.]
MKRIKRLLAVMLALVLCVGPLSGVLASDVVKPTDQFYVADYADVIDSATEEYIVNQNEILYEKTGAQVVVVTVDFIGGTDIEDYAYELFNDWGIGSSEKNNGVLILMVIGEENYWAMQGSGIEDVLTSADLGDLLSDYLEPDFASGDYDAGAKSIFDAISADLASYYGVTLADSSSPSGTPSVGNGQSIKQSTSESGGGGSTVPSSSQGGSSSGLTEALITMIVFIGLILLIVLLIGSRSRRRRTYGGYAPGARSNRILFPPVNRPDVHDSRQDQPVYPPLPKSAITMMTMITISRSGVLPAGADLSAAAGAVCSEGAAVLEAAEPDVREVLSEEEVIPAAEASEAGPIPEGAAVPAGAAQEEDRKKI